MKFLNSGKEDAYHHLKLRIATDDETAFRQLFEQLFPHLSQFAFSLVKSKEASTEIADEIFIRLWHNRKEIAAIENLKVYLYKAAKNSSLNYLARTAKRNVEEPFDEVHVQLMDGLTPESLMITNEILGKIREAVEGLPPRCKMIFKLIREDGLKYKEVADVLNISVKTVDAQMVIAVNAIREKLKMHLDLPVKKIFQKK
ncbi:MAG: RNA polymerase sigma-70 factor [Lacibacter sp.]